MPGADPSDEAKAACDAASACFDERRFVDAIPHAERAAALAPAWASPQWMLAAGYKHAGRWQASLDACERAIELDPDDCQGPQWNAGIAATALGRWPRARQAWKALGIDVPDDDGPIHMALGTVPVRVAPGERPEIIWSQRIDPCRAILRNVPQPTSGRGFRDLVLHDGEARGRRRLGERSVPVFDELAVLEPGGYQTWEAVIVCEDEAARDAVMARFEHVDGELEDWTESLQTLCPACGLGDPDEAAHDHDHEPDDAWLTDRRFGIAVRDERDLEALRRRVWLRRPRVLTLRRVR